MAMSGTRYLVHCIVDMANNGILGRRRARGGRECGYVRGVKL